MKIKDAELLTGLNQKTIRFYESEGLIKVNRLKNSYRDYTEDNIKELRRIKILRGWNVPICKIKDFNKGKVSLNNILQEKLEDLDREELNITKERCVIEQIIKLSTKDCNIDLADYHNDFKWTYAMAFLLSQNQGI